jgi:hypothetical protein
MFVGNAVNEDAIRFYVQHLLECRFQGISLRAIIRVINQTIKTSCRQVENTSFCLMTEVKQRWAWSVLGWVTAQVKQKSRVKITLQPTVGQSVSPSWWQAIFVHDV